MAIYGYVTINGKRPRLPGALERNKQIENEISKDRSIQQQTIKLMLLGNADSGKSTVVKQMKILHMDGFNECEFVNYRYLVFFNIYEAVQSLIQGMEFLKIFFDQETREVTKKFLALAAAETGFNVEILNLASKIWRSNAIRRCIEHKHQLQLLDNAEYFMSNLDRIANENFRPNHLDILFCRAHTTGVHETAFPYKKHMIRLIDVGGQKAERKKWIHCFDDVTAILFVAALSSYDQVLTESPTENRMYDALSLFDETCNSEYFLKTAIILFLNKKDIFQEKIKHVPINVCFEKYKGMLTAKDISRDLKKSIFSCENDYDSSSDYIRQRFIAGRSTKVRQLYSHLTNATNTQNVDNVFTAAIDVVTQKNLGSFN